MRCVLVDDHDQAGGRLDQHAKLDFAPLVFGELFLVDVLRFVGILDDRQIEIQQSIERLDRVAQRRGGARLPDWATS